MATSRNPTLTIPDDASPGTTSVGAGPADAAKAAVPPKPASRPRAKAKPAEGKPAKGSTSAKPRSRAKGAAAPTPAEPAAADGDEVASGAQGASGGQGARSMRDTQGTTGTPGPQGERMSDEERQRRIAEAAYRKAQERGFHGDRQLDDWLEAEREFNHGAGRSR